MNNELVNEYASRIQPLLDKAKKAYGPRDQKTPEHEASREYTRLLSEFHSKGGSLPMLAKKLGVAYAGLRRRVVMSDISVASIKPEKRITDAEEIQLSAERVTKAKAQGVSEYHDQLAVEYQSGVSLSKLAKLLGLSSAAPLYYGVQRSLQRKK